MNYMVIEIAWSRVGKKGVYVEHSLIYYPYSVLFNAIMFFFQIQSIIESGTVVAYLAFTVWHLISDWLSHVDILTEIFWGENSI